MENPYYKELLDSIDADDVYKKEQEVKGNEYEINNSPMKKTDLVEEPKEEEPKEEEPKEEWFSK